MGALSSKRAPHKGCITTSGHFQMIINVLGVIDNLQKPAKIVKIDSLLAEIGALPVWGALSSKGAPHKGCEGLKI